MEIKKLKENLKYYLEKSFEKRDKEKSDHKWNSLKSYLICWKQNQKKKHWSLRQRISK